MTDEATPRTIRLREFLTDGNGAPFDPTALAAFNASLRAGKVRLDWTGVTSISDETLRGLLRGLDLLRDEELLGIETVPDQLENRILAALEGQRAESSPRSQRATRQGTPAGPAPGVWTADDPADDGDTGLSPDDGGSVAVAGENEQAQSDGASAAGSPARVLATASPVEIRDELERLVVCDLLGPAGGPEEIVDETSVRDHYLVGMLAPRRTQGDRAQDDDLAVEETGAPEEGGAEAEVSGPDWMFPSSFGMTFAVDGSVEALRVSATWGRYERVPREKPEDSARSDSGTETVAGTSGDGDVTEPPATSTTARTKSGRRSEGGMVWKRVPAGGTLNRLSLREGQLDRWIVDDGVVVRGVARRRAGVWLVSLFLENELEVPRRVKSVHDQFWLFQPELVVEGVDGRPAFRRRPTGSLAAVESDPLEDRMMALLYRHHLEFAVGHGVGVHAELPPDSTDCAVRLSTRVMPTYEVPKTEPPTVDEIPELAELERDMARLGELEDAQLGRALAPLADAYAAWLERQRGRVDRAEDGLAEHEGAAREALRRGMVALDRIRAGIALLGRDRRAAEAFRFMNRAMALQRTRTIFAEQARRGGRATYEEIDVPANRSWYPFQLAFILLNLPAVTNLHHPDRADDPSAMADLLWFPTGGGKTEAYLGLSAYTLAIRRLQGTVAGRSGEHGVAVLMRYTLRLLTLQQFQRAAALVCACEVLRREALERGDERWGREPFRIGLWVGQRMTPNNVEQSQQAVAQVRDAGCRPGPGVGSPAQLTSCPWCGTKVDPGRDIIVESYGHGQARTLMYCGDTRGVCPFGKRLAPGEGLPVLVVDEEIYRRLPSILISTVDKFAQMPWKGEVQMLFGRVDGRCPRHGFRSAEIEDADRHPKRLTLPAAATVPCGPLRPPDLIIQDELHLISGPLGTLVGLYETAIDELSTWVVDGRRVRPKVVASTATIRRARDQVSALFMRDVTVFPPQGLDVGDNFFSRQREPSRTTPGRKYVGVSAPGRRLKVVLIRVYMAYLAAAQALYEKYSRHADPWMTLVGYFNTMRELGGMKRLVDDDIRSRLIRASERGLANRSLRITEELTSRKASTDIPVVLDHLEVPFDPAIEAERQARRKSGQRVDGKPPIDVLLATNMVSVGVDVRRLGLMVVAGQPKTTAEYIQATSRVGRSAPGLVCTVLNWARPRDLSHYEQFEHYHATFYQQVEAPSVTPFAPRAIDRGLSALLVSLVRLGDARFNANEAAMAIDRNDPLVNAALDAIVRRAWEVSQRADVRADVEDRLKSRLDDWADEAANIVAGRRLGYQPKRDGVTVGLLDTPGAGRWAPFTCLTSLRDVEPSSSLILVDRGMDDLPGGRSAATDGHAHAAGGTDAKAGEVAS